MTSRSQPAGVILDPVEEVSAEQLVILAEIELPLVHATTSGGHFPSNRAAVLCRRDAATRVVASCNILRFISLQR